MSSSQITPPSYIDTVNQFPAQTLGSDDQLTVYFTTRAIDKPIETTTKTHILIKKFGFWPVVKEHITTTTTYTTVTECISAKHTVKHCHQSDLDITQLLYSDLKTLKLKLERDIEQFDWLANGKTITRTTLIGSVWKKVGPLLNLVTAGKISEGCYLSIAMDLESHKKADEALLKEVKAAIKKLNT